MNIYDKIAREVYEPYGTAQYFILGDRVVFITKLDDGTIYDISYIFPSWIEETDDYRELLLRSRFTSYIVCYREGLERYLKETYPVDFPWDRLVY